MQHNMVKKTLSTSHVAESSGQKRSKYRPDRGIDTIDVLAKKYGFSTSEIADLFERAGHDRNHLSFELHRVKEALQKLQTMEAEVDVEGLQAQFLSGHQFCRGYDRDGRPVVWIKYGRNIRGLPPNRFGEHLLAVFWIHLWSLSQRPDGVNQCVWVFDGHGQEALDFSWEYNKEFNRLWDQISFTCPQGGLVYLFGMNRGVRIAVKFSTTLMPRWRKMIKVPKKRSDIFDIVRDPRDVPDDFVSGKGTAFTPSMETLGCFETVLAGRGFAELKLRQMFFPDASEEPFSETLNQEYEPMVPSKSSSWSIPTMSLDTGLRDTSLEAVLARQLSGRQPSLDPVIEEGFEC